MKRIVSYNWILLPVFFTGVLFFYTQLFVEKETLPKEYVFILFSLLLGILLFFKNSQSVQWDRLTVVIFIFTGYILAATIVTGGRSLEILKLVGFLLLFLYFKGSDIKGKYLKTIIVSLCLLQAVYGLLQYFQIIHISSTFPIIGSFDNPAGFAACLAVAFPLAFSLLRESKYYKCLAIVSMIVIGVAVVLSESRAGMVSLGVVSVAFLFFIRLCGKKTLKVISISLFLLIGAAIFLLLLSMKKESASGRVLIWQTTWEMMQDAPVLGHGNGAFTAKYMDYQADYFAQNPESKYAMLADNVLHPFNEYLLLVAEYGFVGLGLLFIVLFFLFKSDGLNSPYLLCLISLGVFSLFSYPLKYPFVWVIVAYCLAKISKSQKPVFVFSFPNKKWFRIIIMLMCFIVGGYFLSKDISFEYQWNKAAKASLFGKTKEVLPEYEHLHHIWNGNYLFLYNYGAELNHVQEYEKSNAILYQCLKYFNDYDVQMLLADNYSNLKQWDKAEAHYLKAADMCPVRFVPLSKLMNLYDAIGQNDKTERMALKIIDKPVKIESSTIRSIKFEAREKINNQNISH
ncbi:MAG: O-antigen ligase family protein [Dysgonamonadaceae bacterium]|jgi:O-antigen ligase|nr:O-antigen ligase family protein [Dysgonamonadaceae bacterium]